jgi:hypothetical protein
MPKKVEEAPQVEVLAEKILERFDPTEDSEIDGDIRFELKLDEATIPADKHPVWVHVSDIPMYKGMRYAEAKAGDDGIEMANGLKFDRGDRMTYRDHVLMLRDRGYHEAAESRAHKANRDLRAKMIKGANKTIFLNGATDGPRAMNQRG